MDFDSITVTDRAEWGGGYITVYFAVPVDHWLAKTWRGDPELAKDAFEYTLCLEYRRQFRTAEYCKVTISPTIEDCGCWTDIDPRYCTLSPETVTKLLQIEEQWLAECQTAKEA